ncbi:hemophore-related protein [Mycolicibacterium thermoresistibile]
MRVSPTRIAVTVGAAALTLTAGSGVAAAQPGMDRLINTTCSYPQVVAALNAHSPALAAEFNEAPVAQRLVSQFIAAPTQRRQQLARQAMATSVGQQYFGSMVQVADTCHNF